MLCGNILRRLSANPASYLKNIRTLASRPRPTSSSVAECVERNQKQREELAAAYQGLHYLDLSEGISNHLSTRAPARDGHGDVILLFPYGLHWSEVTASRLVGVGFDGRVVEGSGQPEETCIQIHCEVHKESIKNGSTMNTIFHLHPPYVSALACHKDPTLRMIHQNSAQFYNDVAYDDGYEGLGNTASEGARIATKMGDKSILLMGNHGTLVMGETVANAFYTSYFLERAAMVQILAKSTGDELVELDDYTANLVRQSVVKEYAFHSDHYFEAIKRLVKKEYIDFTE